VLLQFKKSLSPFPTFQVDEKQFMRNVLDYKLCGKAVGLSGHDCMQNINWK